MKVTLQLFLAGLILGITLGVGGSYGYRAYQASTQPTADATVAGARTPDDGLRPQTIPEQGLSLRIRPTDVIGRLTDEASTVIGVRVFDPLNGEISDAPHVDVVWQRQESFQDLPSATSFDEYQNQKSDVFTVDQAKELTIDGQPAIKQSFVAQVEVPGPFGSKQQRPIPGLRWVIDRGDGEFLILRSSIAAQKYLDLVAMNLTFSEKRAAATEASAPQQLRSNDLQSTIQLEGPDASPKQGTTGLDVAQPDSGGLELKLE